MRVHTVIEAARKVQRERSFIALHRRRPEDFTRRRKLTFEVLMLLLLKKSLKSLQLRLHEFMAEWDPTGQSVTAGALTHARAKLLPSAFIELNQRAVLENVYGPVYAAEVKRWCGLRLLAVDGSLIRLPDSPELFQEFGEVVIANQHGKHDRYPQGRISLLYDVLNDLALDGQLASSKQGEIELAGRHWQHVRPEDVVISDRGYAGYLWLAQCAAHGQFVCRCSQGSFGVAQELIAQDVAGVSRILKLEAPDSQLSELKSLNLPLELTVRFVTLRLASGELEVLASSLVDEQAYPTEAFGELYWRRWDIETFFGRLKGRLELENFSGESVLAVQQDFQAMLFVSNLESVIIAPTQARLAGTPGRQPVQINRAVSLHALKYRVIELLASDAPLEEVLGQLEHWLIHNPVSVRKGRNVARRKVSAFRSYNFFRRVRKIVF
jgi:hypothetical protein